MGAMIFTAMPLSVIGSAPDLSALPVGDSSVGDWNNFPGASMSLNSGFVDLTGAVLRRVTNDTYPVAANAQAYMDYASGGPRISIAHPDGVTYWITACAGSSVYAAKYTRGVGVDSSTWRVLPVASAGNLQYCFSVKSGEHHIVYVAVSNGNEIRRYNLNTQAYETTALFTGANAATSSGGGNPGWMQSSWDGDRLVWMAPYAVPAPFAFTANAGTDIVTNNSLATGVRVQATTTGTLPAGLSLATNYYIIAIDSAQAKLASSLANAVAGTPIDITDAGTGTHTFTACINLNHLTLSSGTLVTYNCSPGNVLNDIRMMRGATRIVAGASNNNLAMFWFVDLGKMTAEGVGTRAGHSECGESLYYAFDPDTAAYPLAKQTAGLAPASDNGAWAGSRTNTWNAGGGTQLNDDDQHPNMSWNQSGAGATEWYCFDSSDIITKDRVTADAWSVDAGSVYRTAVTFNSPQYGNNTRGVTGVLRWNGTTGVGSQITGKLTLAASRLAMTAGTFFWDGTTLYAWMPDSTTPNGKTILKAPALLAESLGYAKVDGTTSRRLCYMYRDTQDVTYSRRGFGNWSPDGKLAMFGSNLGSYSGRSDVLVCEVPLA